jgi:hypothetical protein
MITDNTNDLNNSQHAVPQINYTSSSISNNDMDNSCFNVIQNVLQHKQQIFSSEYNGPIFILIECIDIDKTLGRWHPIKAAKFFSTNFTGITNIKLARFKKKIQNNI